MAGKEHSIEMPNWLIALIIVCVFVLGLGVWQMIAEEAPVYERCVAPSCAEGKPAEDFISTPVVSTDEFKEIMAELKKLKEAQAVETTEVTEDYVLHGDAINSLLPKAKELIKNHACWDLDWAGREEAREQYLVEISKNIQLSYIKNRQFTGVLVFELQQVGEPLAEEVVNVDVDLDDGIVQCDAEDNWQYDWSNLYEAPRD